MALNKIKVNDTTTVNTGVVYDITKATGQSYTNLKAALGTDGNNVPSEVREGGMSIRFVQTSDNKYVQYRLINQNWSTNESDWQGVDDEPTAGSENLVKSSGIYKESQLNYTEASQKVFNVFDINAYNQDAEDYFSVNGTVINYLKADGRSLAGFSYNFYLKGGVRYIFTCNYQSVSTVVVVLLNKATGSLHTINCNPFGEFTPTDNSRYAIKISGYGATTCQIADFVIAEYTSYINEFNKKPIIPSFNINDDAAAINRAITLAYLTTQKTVYIPYKNTPYTINTSILMNNSVNLIVSPIATIKLGDNVSLPMVDVYTRNLSSYLQTTDFSITGGIWDGNSENQEKISTSHNGEWVFGFCFYGVSNVILKDFTIRDAKTFAMTISRCNNITIKNVRILNGNNSINPLNKDGIHFLGNSRNVTIDNCFIESEDNCIAFNADDADLFGGASVNGDIHNISVRNITINNTGYGQGIRLLSAEHKIKNVIVENIQGSGRYLMILDHYSFSSTGNIEDVIINNINFEWLRVVNSYDCITFNTKLKNVSLSNIHIKETVGHGNGTNTSFIKFKNSSTTKLLCNSVCFKNISCDVIVGHDVFSCISMENYLFDSVIVENLQNTIDDTVPCTPVSMVNCIGSLLFSNSQVKGLFTPGWLYLYGSTLYNLMLSGLSTNDVLFNGITLSNSVIVTANISNCGRALANMQMAKTCISDTNKVFVYDESYPSTSTDNATYSKGQEIINYNFGKKYICKEEGCPANYSQWQPNTSYSRGSFVVYQGKAYKCMVGGTSGKSFGGSQVVNDGTCLWYRGMGTLKSVVTIFDVEDL